MNLNSMYPAQSIGVGDLVYCGRPEELPIYVNTVERRGNFVVLSDKATTRVVSLFVDAKVQVIK